jgi:hypothetical protein
MNAVTVYSSAYAPDPANARDVLAFVLTPIAAFAPGGDDAEMAAVAELLGSAKLEAVKRWYDLSSAAQRS